MIVTEIFLLTTVEKFLFQANIDGGKGKVIKGWHVEKTVWGEKNRAGHENILNLSGPIPSGSEKC